MYLSELLSDLKDKLMLPKIEDGDALFGYIISVKPEYSKQKIVEFLEQNKIGTRQLFAGNILRQPMFTDNMDVRFRVGNSKLLSSNDLNENIYNLLPNTDFVMNNTFWVGIFPGLSKFEMEKISEVLHKFFTL